MRKRIFLPALILATVVFSFTVGGHQLNAQEELPLPAGAQLEKRELRRIAGAEMELSYYSSAQGAGQIRNFYRRSETVRALRPLPRQLINSGWGSRGMP